MRPVPELARYSTTLGFHAIQDLERLLLTMRVSLRMTSYHSARTLVINPLVQPSRILKSIAY